MLVSQTEHNHYYGKMLIGRIHSGKIATGAKVHALDSQGNVVESSKISKIIRRLGINQVK